MMRTTNTTNRHCVAMATLAETSKCVAVDGSGLFLTEVLLVSKLGSNISNTRKSVSSGYPKTEKSASQTIHHKFYAIKIKIRYPNHPQGSNFLCFLFMNY